MKRVSSQWTFFYKRVFPVVWTVGLLAIFGIGLYARLSHARGNIPLPFFIVLPIMFGFGFYFMKKFVFDLVDEVWDDGHALLVKNNGQQERIALGDIKNVNYSPLVNPPRVILSLRRPTLFGDKIAFCAPVRFVPFAGSAAIDELIERVDAARRKHA